MRHMAYSAAPQDEPSRMRAFHKCVWTTSFPSVRRRKGLLNAARTAHVGYCVSKEGYAWDEAFNEGARTFIFPPDCHFKAVQ